MLTILDSCRSEPFRQDEPRHHERQRRGRSYTILPCFRHVLVGMQGNPGSTMDKANVIQLTGKLHFGYIYGRLFVIVSRVRANFCPGLAFVGTILLHQVLSLMSPTINPAEVSSGHDHGHPQGSHLGSSLTYPRSASVLGYCLLPLVLVAMLGIVIPLDGLFGYLLTSLAIAWCSYASSSMFTVVGECRKHIAFQIQALTSTIRSHDIDEGLSSISNGAFLW